MTNHPEGETYARDVQREYDRIDRQWMLLHYRTIIGIIAIGILVELALAYFFYGMESSIAISFEKYAEKFMLRPLLLNIGWLSFTIAARYIHGIGIRTRIYMGSIALIGACFVFYSTNYIFYISMIFFAPVLLTAFYGEHRLTMTVAVISLLTKLYSDFFVFWDATRELPFESCYALMRIIVSTLLLAAFYIVSVIIIFFQKKKNDAVIQIERERGQMYRQMVTDPLTGIHNRLALRNMFQIIENTVSDTYYFAMLDLDDFKQLNDTFGHAKGDECLMKIGGLLRKHSDKDIMPFRFGGDEFCILFRNKSREEVTRICKLIREEFSTREPNQPTPSLTISVGIARYEQGMFAEDLIQNADKAMYRAKRQKDAIVF